jgi:hypothetical protein
MVFVKLGWSFATAYVWYLVRTRFAMRGRKASLLSEVKNIGRIGEVCRGRSGGVDGRIRLGCSFVGGDSSAGVKSDRRARRLSGYNVWAKDSPQQERRCQIRRLCCPAKPSNS